MEKIILDADMGIDDVFALLLSIYSKKIDLKAVTTVEGNCILENANKNALKILEMSNCNNIPVYSGMDKPLQVEGVHAEYVHGKNGIGGVEYTPAKTQVEDKSAIDYLVEETSKYPNEITIVAIGPLTNIALAVQKDPDFVKNVKRLIIMGSAEGAGNVTPDAEFNFYRDPHAAKIVMESGFKDIVLVGLDVTNRIPLIKKLEEMLLNINTELSKFLYKATRMGAEFDRNEGLDGLILNDPLTIAYLIDNSVLKLKNVDVEIETDGEKRGKSIIKNSDNSNYKFAYDLDINKFYKILFSEIFPENIEIINQYIK